MLPTAAWATVGAFGTASTGAPIAGLAGAAHTSAVLAWLGGGSLATGGGGMLVGTTVLGGLAVAPAAVGAYAYSEHSKANRLRRENESREAQIKEMDAATRRWADTERIRLEATSDLRRATATYRTVLRHSLRGAYPWPLLSRLRRWLRSRTGRPRFTALEFAMLVQPALEAGEYLLKAITGSQCDQART